MYLYNKSCSNSKKDIVISACNIIFWLNSIVFHSSALDSVREALRLLDSVSKTPQNEEQLQDDKAQALLWLYICTIEDKMHEVCSSEESGIECLKWQLGLWRSCLREAEFFDLGKNIFKQSCCRVIQISVCALVMRGPDAKYSSCEAFETFGFAHMFPSIPLRPWGLETLRLS